MPHRIRACVLVAGGKPVTAEAALAWVKLHKWPVKQRRFYCPACRVARAGVPEVVRRPRVSDLVFQDWQVVAERAVGPVDARRALFGPDRHHGSRSNPVHAAGDTGPRHPSNSAVPGISGDVFFIVAVAVSREPSIRPSHVMLIVIVTPNNSYS